MTSLSPSRAYSPVCLGGGAQYKSVFLTASPCAWKHTPVFSPVVYLFFMMDSLPFCWYNRIVSTPNCDGLADGSTRKDEETKV